MAPVAPRLQRVEQATMEQGFGRPADRERKVAAVASRCAGLVVG